MNIPYSSLKPGDTVIDRGENERGWYVWTLLEREERTSYGASVVWLNWLNLASLEQVGRIVQFHTEVPDRCLVFRVEDA